MLSQYYTVKGYGENEIIIQKSRFIAYINRVETEEEAQQFIADIKKTELECHTQLLRLYDRRNKFHSKGKR